MRQKRGVPLVIELAIPGGYVPSANVANVLHADWGAIGVTVNIHVWADSQFFAPATAGGVIQSGNFDAALFPTAALCFTRPSRRTTPASTFHPMASTSTAIAIRASRA